jgi:hypothetical protein
MDHSGHLAGGHNWWVPAANQMGGLSPSSATVGGGGGMLYGNTQGIQFRSPLDARRAAKGQLSQAEWPDGYLGNIIDRRQDKLLQAVRARQEGPSYQRGVHKGSRIDPKQYFWPADDMGPDEGIDRRTQVAVDDYGMVTMVQKRQAPKGQPIQVLVNDGKSPPQADGEMNPKKTAVMQDPLQVIHFHKMMPKYSIGGGR